MAQVRQETEGNAAWRRMWTEAIGFFWALVGMLIAVCDLTKFLLEKCRGDAVEQDDAEYFDVGPEWTPPSNLMPTQCYVKEEHAPLQSRGMEAGFSKQEKEVHEPLNFPAVNTRTSRAASEIVTVKGVAVWCADCNHPTPAYSSIDLPYNCKGRSNSRHKWYAVAVGKVGPGLFVTWEETQWQVCGCSGQMHKSFATEFAANEYLGASLTAIGYNGDSPHRQNVQFVGRDKFGHVVGRCACCDEIFCDNGA